MQVGPFTIYDSHVHPIETMTLGDIIAESSNIGAALVANEVGNDQLGAYMQRFGYGQPTGIGFPGEAAGVLLPASQWDEVIRATVSYGQGISVTPLQMALVAAAVANGGTIMQPTLIDRIVDPDGKVIQRSEPDTWKEAMTPKTAAELTAMMTAVVQGGTGVAAQIPGVQVAGKTGTAETGRTGENDTWFIAFAPAENPQVAVAVALSNQSGTGGATAAPIAKEIIEALLR